MNRNLQNNYVPPSTTPAPSPPVCHRIATNQIGDRQVISLNEPILDVPGSGTWTGADSGTTGLHQRFLYEEVRFGLSRIRDMNYVTEDAPLNNFTVSVEAEVGDILFAACYVRHATIVNTAIIVLEPSPVVFDTTSVQADGAVGHFIAGHHLIVADPKGSVSVTFAFPGIGGPTYAIGMVASIKGALASIDDFNVGVEAAANPGLTTLINTFDWNQNLCFFATHESGIGHTVPGPWVEELKVTHSDMFFTLISRVAPSEDSSFFPNLTVDNWSAANTLMGGVAIRAGNFVETLDQQYIVLLDPVGSGFEDGEALTNA